MSQAFPADTAALFERMDAKARQVIERRFHVRLNSNVSSESQQAAWDVYQTATVKLLEALRSGVEIADPEGYAARTARNRCYDYWREHSPDWFDLKGRLYRFFGKQPAWTRWNTAEPKGWICGPAAIRNSPLAESHRVAALLDNPRRISSRALPKREVFQQLDAADWDRLLTGIFDYLGGPVRMDELVSIAGVLFGVRGSRVLAFDEMSPAGEDGPKWEPPAPPAATLDRLVIREQLARLWAEIKTMPKRWVIPFLLNPPSIKGGQAKSLRNRGGAEPAKPERGEIEVFTANGLTTVSEIAALLGFDDAQYSYLWGTLAIEAQGGPPLAALPDPVQRFGVIWSLLPVDDEVIAGLMALESSQKVINLRTVAKNHLARILLAGTDVKKFREAN